MAVLFNAHLDFKVKVGQMWILRNVGPKKFSDLYHVLFNIAGKVDQRTEHKSFIFIIESGDLKRNSRIVGDMIESGSPPVGSLASSLGRHAESKIIADFELFHHLIYKFFARVASKRDSTDRS